LGLAARPPDIGRRSMAATAAAVRDRGFPASAGCLSDESSSGGSQRNRGRERAKHVEQYDGRCALSHLGKDGPILEALKGLRGTSIRMLRRKQDAPDRDRLAQRFEVFSKANAGS